jgi:hypothetical protein
MSISLFCYSSLLVKDVNRINREIINKHSDVFSYDFQISEIKELKKNEDYYDEVYTEIATEYGLNAMCLFLIILNNKNSISLLAKVENIFKDAFGEKNIIILLNNEHKR